MNLTYLQSRSGNPPLGAQRIAEVARFFLQYRQPILGHFRRFGRLAVRRGKVRQLFSEEKAESISTGSEASVPNVK